MSDFINRAALLGYLSKKCAEKDYTTSDMLSDIEKYGKNGEVSPLPTLPKEFEIVSYPIAWQPLPEWEGEL